MKRETLGRIMTILVLLAGSLWAIGNHTRGVNAQNAPLAQSLQASSPEHAILGEMVGTWRVQARIWTGPNAKPMTLPPAIAKRRLIGGKLLEEVMTPVPGSHQTPFTRIADINYNDMTGQYEWNSWDTRAPQMMHELNHTGTNAKQGQNGHVILFYLDSFVLPKWGGTINAAFRQRRVFEIGKDRQVSRQYWTPIAAKNAREFLAFEYVYTRQG